MKLLLNFLKNLKDLENKQKCQKIRTFSLGWKVFYFRPVWILFCFVIILRMNKVTFLSKNPIKNLCTDFFGLTTIFCFTWIRMCTPQKNYAFVLHYKTLHKYCLVDIFREIANTFVKFTKLVLPQCGKTRKYFVKTEKKLFKNDQFEFRMNLGFWLTYALIKLQFHEVFNSWFYFSHLV